MKKKYYTVQIIPEDSHGIKQYKISSVWFTAAKIALVAFILIAGVFIFNLGKINKIVASYEKMRVTNAQLIKKDNNYETFIENDSAKINSIIDRNRFAHTPNEKINVDYDNIHSWESGDEKIRLERIPSILPVAGLESKKYSEAEEHLGVDFSAPAGSPVFATGSGVVEFSGDMDELGNTVVIDHQNGYKSSYSHLKDIRVRKGRSINKGGIIGTVGTTGNASGAHLHYEITKDGKKINPEIFTNY